MGEELLYYQNSDMTLARRFRGLHSADAVDLMGTGHATSSRLRRIGCASGAVSVGRALTLRTPPGDNMMLHVAMAAAGPGDFILVETAPGEQSALVGEIMLTYFFQGRRIAGFAVDGPVRDVDAVGSRGWPVYAVGSTPQGPSCQAGGQMQVPISFCGVPVSPGDTVIADGDGIAVIPAAMADLVTEKSGGLLERNGIRLEDSRRGDISPVSAALIDAYRRKTTAGGSMG